MEFNERRRLERYTYEESEIAYVEIRLPKDLDREEIYSLRVNDCSNDGIGILVTKKNLGLLRTIKKGDKIEDISFFAPWTVFKMDGTVMHKSKVEKDPQEVSYILGIRSQDSIDNFKPTFH